MRASAIIPTWSRSWRPRAAAKPDEGRPLARLFLSAAIAAIVGLAAASPVHAQAYPNRPIRLLVPFPAGGPVDVMGRLIAQHLSTALGQQVIVDNRPGAGSTLAAKAAATAEP